MKNIAKPCTPAWRLPWNVTQSDDKGRARFNIIAHLLGSIDDMVPPRVKPELPERQKRGSYRGPDYLSRLVPEEC